jgi:hypothetical protein
MIHVPRPRTLASRSARRSVAVVGAAVVAGAALWMAIGPAGSSPAARTTTTGPDKAASGVASAAPPAAPPLGAYVGPGEAAAAATLDQQLDGKLVYVLDFLSKSTWTSLIDVTWLVADWAGSPYQMVLGVPMLPATGASLAQGAAGAYDGQFSVLAQRLVAGGFADAVLMIGWQPDDPGNPWYVTSAAAARDYVTYWDDIRSTMAAVPGAHFTFEWDAGDSGISPLSPASMYPGDAAVNIVATDAFDVAASSTPADARWSKVLNERYGPAWMASFAAVHHKPMALAMWGEVPTTSGGSGDDASYVTQLLQWAGGAGLQMCVMWDYGTWAVSGGGFPAADAALVGAVTSPVTADAADAADSAVVHHGWDAPQTGEGRAVRTLSPEPQRSAARVGTAKARRGLGSD